MTRTLSLSDGKKIPALGWGNGTGGLFGADEKAAQTGKLALDQGIYHIDTAQLYKTEKATAEAIKLAGVDRSKVWVTTKISADNLKATPDAVRANVQESLDKLGFIPDLILIHNPGVPEEGKIAEFWTVLEGLVDDGTLKGTSLGFSNYRPQDIEAVISVAKIKPVINQVEFHPFVLSHLQPVLDLHKKHGIVTQAYGPLTPLLRHPSKGGPLKPVLSKIAQRLSQEIGKDVDEASVLLLWTIQSGVSAVTTSGNPENIKKLAFVDSLPDLTKEEIQEIDTVGRKIHFRHYAEHMSKDFPSPDLPEDL